MTKRNRKKVKKEEKDNRLNLLVDKYLKDVKNIEDNGITEFINNRKVLVKTIDEDNDIKIRLSNSYIIDDKKFQLEELEIDNNKFIIIDNEILSLIYRENNNKALLYRNGNLVRVYFIPEYLKEDIESYKQFFTILLEIIEENPELTL